MTQFEIKLIAMNQAIGDVIGDAFGSNTRQCDDAKILAASFLLGQTLTDDNIDVVLENMSQMLKNNLTLKKRSLENAH